MMDRKAARDVQKRSAAEAAAALVEDGMVVGLGTGSTAWFAIEALIRRVRDGLNILGIATSERSDAQARAGGIPITTFAEHRRLDLTIDGADEIADGSLDLIKGLGGALLREKIVASASARMVVIVDESKLVEVLGRFPLPIEVVPFGLRATYGHIERAVAQAGCPGPLRLRQGRDGHPFVTDGGHLILDAALERIPDPSSLAARLAEIPGVVEHGLFVGLAHSAIIASAAGVQVLQHK
jgi:ribose 5-phosphate isomerase A